MGHAPPKPGADGGFVLPYVLLTITVMSILLTLAVSRMSDVTRSVERFSADADADLALASLEAEATFRLLSAVPVDAGLGLFDPSALSVDMLDTEFPDAVSMLGGRGTRVPSARTPGASFVARDMAGLIPLNSLDADIMTLYLRSLGLGTDEAAGLTGKWMDYVDTDNRRSFRGAERGEYALKGRPAPSNHPVRSHAEMQAILDWDDFLVGDLRFQFMDETSTNDRLTYFTTQHADPALVERLEKASVGGRLERVVARNADFVMGERTSDAWRLELDVPVASGGRKIMVLDVERQIGALHQPFRRNVVYKRTRPAAAAAQTADAR